jgi:hypothetical protein
MDMSQPGSTMRMAAWLEEAWLERYLNRRLTADEANWFEAYVLDKSDMLQALENDTMLRDALAEVAESSKFSRISVSRARQPIAPRRRFRWGRLANAASLAVAAVLGGLVGQRLMMTTERSAPDAQLDALLANPPRVIFETMRGPTSRPSRYEPGESRSPILLVDIPIPTDCQIDHARLLVGDKIHTLPKPAVSPDGYATYAIPRVWRDGARIELTFERPSESCPSLLHFDLNGSR